MFEKRNPIIYPRKEPKYRQNRKFFYEKAKVDIVAGLNESIEAAWCIKHDHAKNLFNEWKSNIIQEVDSGIHHLSRKVIYCALKETMVK